MDEEEILQKVIEETLREAIHLRQRIKKPTRERNRLESRLIEERRKWRTKRNER